MNKVSIFGNKIYISPFFHKYEHEGNRFFGTNIDFSCKKLVFKGFEDANHFQRTLDFHFDEFYHE